MLQHIAHSSANRPANAGHNLDAVSLTSSMRYNGVNFLKANSDRDGKPMRLEHTKASRLVMSRPKPVPDLMLLL